MGILKLEKSLWGDDSFVACLIAQNALSSSQAWQGTLAVSLHVSQEAASKGRRQEGTSQLIRTTEQPRTSIMLPGRMVTPMQVKIRPTRLALSGQLKTGQTRAAS